MKKLLLYLLLTAAPTLMWAQNVGAGQVAIFGPQTIDPSEAVTSATGTEGQVLVDGAFGTPQTGDVTLSLPTAITGVNSITSATGQGLTLAALDGNNSITLTPSGTGAINLNVTSGGVRLPSTATAGLQLYNTADQVTNTENFVASWSSNVFRLQTVNGGSGTLRNLRLGTSNSSTGAQVYFTIGTSPADFFRFSPFTSLSTSSFGGTGTWASWFDSATSTSTSGTNNVFAIRPTYNQASGTAANTDLLINRTQTAVGSGAQFLIDAQVGGTSQFSITNGGTLQVTGSVRAAAGGAFGFGTTRAKMESPADGIIELINAAGSGFSRLQFGGTSSSFPALKRSATALQARLADDSADAPITASNATLSGVYIGSTQALSGPGAANVTTETTLLTTTGVADAITLADGINGQTKIIVHAVDGGSAVLTPTTKTGFSTVTFTNAGESVTLKFYTTIGWVVVGDYLAVIAP